tara:strand:- start:244 stop:663 length:420 start_codon:yes stop_codon:yes gene_type:complete
MSYHVFYNSNREVVWSTNADVNDEIKSAEAAKGFSYLQTNLTDIPQNTEHYINIAKDTVVAKTSFTPTFSTLTPEVDATVNVTGVPAGTEVFLDGVSKGNMSNTTLTFTATEPGTYTITLKKLEYLDYNTALKTKRQTE